MRAKNVKMWSILVAIWFLSLGVEVAKCEKYGGGSGTAADPYLLYTPEQLNTIGTNPGDWNKHFKLMADIDLSGYTGTAFNIIATGGQGFGGVFDGNGHVI